MAITETWARAVKVEWRLGAPLFTYLTHRIKSLIVARYCANCWIHLCVEHTNLLYSGSLESRGEDGDVNK